MDKLTLGWNLKCSRSELTVCLQGPGKYHLSTAAWWPAMEDLSADLNTIGHGGD